MAESDIESRFLYRRQFIIADRRVRVEAGWRSAEVAGRKLSWHPDLEVCFAGDARSQLVLLGYLVDPLEPEASSQEVLDRIAAASDFDDVIRRTEPLSGRWALVHADSSGLRIFHDACGLRSVHHARMGDQVVCASDPELIRQVVPLAPNPDAEYWRLVRSDLFLLHKESDQYGNETDYAGCYRLLPNRWLDLGTGRETRYFPSTACNTRPVEDVACDVAQLLRGGIQAMALRAQLSLGVTAGLDSRTLLAAAMPVRGRLHYHVARYAAGHPMNADIIMAKRLARQVGFRLQVVNGFREVPDWYADLHRRSVAGARFYKATPVMYEHLRVNSGHVILNGNMSEVGRRFYHHRGAVGSADPVQMASLAEFPGDPYVVRQLTDWLREIDDHGLYGYDVLDLMYWEHRMGNWAARYVAEQDMALEQFSPYNNRRLLRTLLEAPLDARTEPECTVYRVMISQMWPDGLQLPINPQTDHLLVARLGKAAFRARRAVRALGRPRRSFNTALRLVRSRLA